MEYQALYRKWRPRGFADFVGQPHVVRTLKNAVAQNRIAHAYLFCGPRGTGKTTAAKILARAVNCEASRDGDPCGVCPSCRRIGDGISLDVQEIDGASNRGIDEVRDLREKVRFAPAEGRFRVYIIDEIHMLTAEAFNALLKTLEEPPPQVIFVFATTEPHKLPATVLSRCQRFDFKRFGLAEISGRLREISEAEKIEASEEAIALIAAQAAGGMRDAIGLLEQAAVHAGEKIEESDVREVLGLVDLEIYRRLAESVQAQDPGAALAILAEVSAAGKDLVQLARGAVSLWRDLLVLAVSRKEAPLQVLPPEGLDDWRQIASALGPERLLAGLELLASVVTEQKRAGEGRLPLDLAVIKLAANLSPAAPEDQVRPSRTATIPAKQTPAEKIVSPASELEKARPAPARKTPAAEVPADRWRAIQEQLKKRKPSLAALISQHAHAQGQQDHAFTLLFAHKHFAEKVLAERALIEQIFAEVCGEPLTLRCEVGVTPAPDKTGQDPIAEAVRLFDGHLEEE